MLRLHRDGVNVNVALLPSLDHLLEDAAAQSDQILITHFDCTLVWYHMGHFNHIQMSKIGGQSPKLWVSVSVGNYTVRKANFPIHEIANFPRNKNLTLMCNTAIEYEFCQLLGHIKF